MKLITYHKINRFIEENGAIIAKITCFPIFFTLILCLVLGIEIALTQELSNHDLKLLKVLSYLFYLSGFLLMILTCINCLQSFCKFKIKRIARNNKQNSKNVKNTIKGNNNNNCQQAESIINK